MIDFYLGRLLKVLFYVSLGLIFQACSKEKSKKEEPKPSQSVSAPISTVSSSANAVPVSQSVRPTEFCGFVYDFCERCFGLRNFGP